MFADLQSLEAPLRIPLSELNSAISKEDPEFAPTAVYTGISAPSICRGMDTHEVAELFSGCKICIRSYDFSKGLRSRPPPRRRSSLRYEGSRMIRESVMTCGRRDPPRPAALSPASQECNGKSRWFQSAGSCRSACSSKRSIAAFSSQAQLRTSRTRKRAPGDA